MTKWPPLNLPKYISKISEHAAVRAGSAMFPELDLTPQIAKRAAAVISKNSSRVMVRVIRTDEELMIARSVLRSCAKSIAR